MLLCPWDSPDKNTGEGSPSSGDLPHPGVNPGSPALQADSLPSEPPVLHSKRYPNQEGLKPASLLLWEEKAWVRVCRHTASTSTIPRPVPVAGITNGAPISPPPPLVAGITNGAPISPPPLSPDAAPHPFQQSLPKSCENSC